MAKDGQYPYILIGGINKSDFTGEFNEVAKSTLLANSITLGIQAAVPKFPKIKDDKKRVSGVTKAARKRKKIIEVEFMPFFVLQNSTYNDHGDKINLFNILSKDYIYFIEIAHDRGSSGDGYNYWAGEYDPEDPNYYGIREYCIEPIEESVSSNKERGTEEISITFELTDKLMNQ